MKENEQNKNNTSGSVVQQIIKKHFPDISKKELLQQLQDACIIAYEALKDKVRDNGHPFFEHPLNVALIAMNEIGLQEECLPAVFLHESKIDINSEQIAQYKFSKEILNITEGLNKIATIKPKDTKLEAENYKKLIVEYSTDPRVTVLKIADRLEVMRNLESFPKLSRNRKILETLMLYIPLAHQLGLYNIKKELENMYFSYSDPESYRFITNKLKATEKDRIKLMNEFIEPLKKKLSDAGIKYKLKIRTKSAYSIKCKMTRQRVPFEGVFDVFAIRFIIDCEPNTKTEQNLCWKVYSFVTEEYEPDIDRLRDWITNPKPNGYESLHITVKNKDNSYVEVQIRTKRMDDEAENGHASHWAYKGIKREGGLDTWLASARYALEHPGSTSPEDLPQPPSNEIFVFTPSGELRILPVGATVLDFAFDIHTKLGSSCTGGRINGKAAPIKEKLQTGDVVEIMRSKNQKPSADWLNYVTTSKARTKIKQDLNEAECKKAADGKELTERRLKNWKMEFPDELLTIMLKKLHYSTINAFYAAIGTGELDVNVIKTYILNHNKKQSDRCSNSESSGDNKNKSDNSINIIDNDDNDSWATANKEGLADDILVINAKNMKGLDYKMARCCHPVFGDDVFGFVTRTKGITIHRISCPNAARLFKEYPYRIQKVKWANSPSSGAFQTTIKITAAHEESVLRHIMEITDNFKASIRSMNVKENPRNANYEITLKISVPSNMELNKVISQTRLLKHVLKVKRQ